MTSNALASSLSLPLLRSRLSTHFYPVRWCALCTRSFLEEVWLKMRTYFSVYRFLGLWNGFGHQPCVNNLIWCIRSTVFVTSLYICIGLKNGDAELWAKWSVSWQRQLLSWLHTHRRLDSITISSLLVLDLSQAFVMVMLHLFASFRIFSVVSSSFSNDEKVQESCWQKRTFSITSLHCYFIGLPSPTSNMIKLSVKNVFDKDVQLLSSDKDPPQGLQVRLNLQLCSNSSQSVHKE